MEVYGTEQGQTEEKQGVLDSPVFFVFLFFPSELFPREILSVHARKKKISHSSHLSSSSHDFPHFQCFTCKNVLIRYKNQNSRYFSFLLPYSFALKNKLCVFFFLNPHFSFLFLIFQTSLWFQLISICSYMCWASIMSKYLASMI